MEARYRCPRADVPLAADLFHYMAGWATKIEGNTIPISVPYAPGVKFHAYTLREPVGVVGQIIPWNFPFLMAAWKLGPALATGCTVVLKPAEETPLSALRLGELIQEAGFPNGVVNIITGFGETAGAALAAHPEVDKVAFTGSTEVGKLILQAATNDLKKVSLELGGKSPNVVLRDADLDLAVNGHGKCHLFQSRSVLLRRVTTVRASRVSLTSSLSGVADEGQEDQGRSGARSQNRRWGRWSPKVSTTACAVISSLAWQKARKPSRAVGSLGARGILLNPPCWWTPHPDMKVIREEIFGPVVAAIPFKELDDALVRAANDTIYGLAAGVWTKDHQQGPFAGRQAEGRHRLDQLL